MTGRLEWPDPTEYLTPDEERRMDAERECQTCNGTGRVEVFTCKGGCNCGSCPDLEDCPECCGHELDEASNEEPGNVWRGADVPFADNH